MTYIILFTICLILFVSVLSNSNDCKNPVDCYTKAIAILQEDRAEMRRQLDLYQNKYEETQKQLNEYSNKFQKLNNELNGFVAYFEGECPSGWKEYSEAAGRFILSSGVYTGNSLDGRVESQKYDLLQVGGEIQHQLTISEMPSHNHSDDPTRKGLLYERPDCLSTSHDTDTTCGEPDLLHSYPMINQGGNSPHNNMPPYIVLKACKRQN
jgi:hypothetical protein